MKRVRQVIDLTIPTANIDPRLKKSIKYHRKRAKFGRSKAKRRFHRSKLRYWQDIYEEHKLKAFRLDLKASLHRFAQKFKSNQGFRNICREYLREEKRQSRRPFIRVLTFV